jgi:hypothetical protein
MQVTRWWSTFSMLEWLLNHKPLVDIFLGHHRDEFQSPGKLLPEPFTENEWNVIVGIEAILKPAKEAVKLLEGEKYPTVHLVYPVLANLHDAWSGLAQLKVRTAFGEGSHDLLVTDLHEDVRAAAGQMVCRGRWWWCCCHDT